MVKRIVLGVVLSWSSLALACKVASIEPASKLVAHADSIVRAVVLDAPDPGQVRFKVLEVLKGPLQLQAEFRLEGQLDHYDGPNEKSVPYEMARLGARHGDCFATDYAKGKQFLLFLKDGVLLRSPMAPVNEEVHGPKDDWVVHIKGQLHRKM